MSHIPVMLPEVIETLKPLDGQVYVDGTFGAGGYSRAILKAAHCRVYALDQDPDAREFASALEREFPGRFAFLLGNFSDMCALLAAQGVARVDGVVMDLGVSSMQLDRAERGFSFSRSGPLDMRMGKEGMTAFDLVNSGDEKALADILYQYGEDRASRRIARAIVSARAMKPIETTAELAEIVSRATGKTGRTHPATRAFQALRIHVNDEMGALARGLSEAEQILKPGGRLVVVTFHSLEDRLVKRFFLSRCDRLAGESRHLPPAAARSSASFWSQPKKIQVSPAEAAANPRARSATLRAAARTGAP